jgi:hypothetical protein
MNFILKPIACVLRSIGPQVTTLSVFAAALVISLIFTTVSPLFYTPSMLQIVHPVSLILRTIGMRVNSITMCLIVLPLSIVFVAMYVPKNTFSVSFIILPGTFIASTIGPGLSALSMTHFLIIRPGQPLSNVFGSIFECMFWSTFKVFSTIFAFFNWLYFILLETVMFFESCLILSQLFAALISSIPSLEFYNSF